MIKKILALSIVLLAAAFPALAGDINMEEGLWEITTQTSMPGMEMPPYTDTQCLTQEDLVPQADQPNQQCEMIDFEVDGDTVRWTMECTGQGGNTTAKGEVTYYGDSFEGAMTMTMPGMEMTSTMSGRRIGDCP